MDVKQPQTAENREKAIRMSGLCEPRHFTEQYNAELPIFRICLRMYDEIYIEPVDYLKQ